MSPYTEVKVSKPQNPTSDHSVRFCGHFERNTTASTTSTSDATANRSDADKNGGAPSRPIRIAGHVEPQIRQSIAKAALRVELLAIRPRRRPSRKTLGPSLAMFIGPAAP